MTAKRRLGEDSIEGWLIFILFLFLSLKSCVVKGQAMAYHNGAPVATRCASEVFDRTHVGNSASSLKN